MHVLLSISLSVTKITAKNQGKSSGEIIFAIKISAN
jgi:hypothetical protein